MELALYVLYPHRVAVEGAYASLPVSNTNFTMYLQFRKLAPVHSERHSSLGPSSAQCQNPLDRLHWASSLCRVRRGCHDGETGPVAASGWRRRCNRTASSQFSPRALTAFQSLAHPHHRFEGFVADGPSSAEVFKSFFREGLYDWVPDKGVPSEVKIAILPQNQVCEVWIDLQDLSARPHCPNPVASITG